MVCVLDGPIQLSELGVKRCSGFIAVIPRGMALHAHSLRAGAKLRIRWMGDGMVAMAHHATGHGGRVKSFLMRALVVHLGLEDMAGGADVLNLVHSRRNCAMVPVAGCASGRAQIAVLHHILVVHAGDVLGMLIGGNPIRLHVSRVGVAPRAGLCHVEGVDCGSGIAGRP